MRSLNIGDSFQKFFEGQYSVCEFLDLLERKSNSMPSVRDLTRNYARRLLFIIYNTMEVHIGSNFIRGSSVSTRPGRSAIEMSVMSR